MSQDNFLKKALTDSILSRRSFMKWSAALGGAAAVAGGVGYGLRSVDAADHEAADEGRWIPVACWADCGSKGLNKVLVKDGVIVRSGTDDSEDSPENPQLRACAKGRAQRQRLLGPDRLKYPMVRKHWAPGGGDKELRGRDEWVRISWDEALDILASELKRIKETHGNEAIYSPTPSTASIYTEVARTLSLFGGFVSDWASCSSGTWTATGPAIGLPRGRQNTGEDMNDFNDLPNAQLIVMWGYNPAWSRAGLPAYAMLRAKKAGAKFICVDPFFTPTAVAMGVSEENWVPVRPATDTALVLGIMHTLLVEDDPKTNPLINWDFLNTHTVGFDADHMPEGADPKENLKDYLLGTFDSTPKTAEWAAEICGVHPDKIRELAREIATTEKVAILMSPAPARINNGDNWPQAIMTLGAMTGHLGSSGNMVGSDGGHGWLVEGDQLVKGGTWIGRPTNFPDVDPVPNPLAEVRMNRNEVWDAIMTGKYTVGKGETRDINVQMLYFAKVERINQAAGTVKAIQAFRNVEFVVVQDMFLTPSAKFADLVLPITSLWERPGNMSPGYREYMLLTSQAIDPLFESKDDVWVARELALRLGLDAERVQPYDTKQDLFNQIAKAEVINDETGEYERLVTITQEDIDKWGVMGEPQQGRVGLDEFQQKGIYRVEREKGDKHKHIMLEDFVKDPEENPLDSPSGKLEIHCQRLADSINAVGFSEIRPIPTYIPPVEGIEDTYADWENKVKGEYPFQLLNLHVARRAHSNFDNTPWMREAFDHKIMVNPVDAETLDIVEDETVLISSRHGRILRRVHVTENVRPGVIGIGQGAWLDWDDDLQLDRGGCANVLCGNIRTGQGHQGWNSANIRIDKWEGEPLQPDYLWPQRIVKFANEEGVNNG